MMRHVSRRGLLTGAGFATVLATVSTTLLNGAAYADQAGKLRRVGFLGQGAPANHAARFAALRTELARLGYVEGRNIGFEYRYANGSNARLPALAADLARLRLDVVVATGTPSANALKKASGAVPIVMHAGNPVASGLVSSLSRPGGNVTGLTVISGPEFYGKRLELLREVSPNAKRIAVLWNPKNAAHRILLDTLGSLMRGHGVTPISMPITKPNEIGAGLADASRTGAQAMLLFGSPTLNTHRKRIIAFCAENRLPAMFTHRGWIEDGGLMAYGIDFIDLYRRMGKYVGKILDGADPAELPVERPTKFELTINLKTAAKLGLEMPHSLMLRADRVVE